MEKKEQLTGEYCPTCHQKIPDVHLHSIRMVNFENKNSLNKKLEVLEVKHKIGNSEYDSLLTRKLVLEQEINEIIDKQILLQKSTYPFTN
jgi:hypothetical protein